MKRVVIPSIIAKSQKELDERISKIDSNIYQLDFMDGKFVRNKSLMFEFKVPIGKKYEAHLMVSNPEAWVSKNWEKVDTIIFHFESVKNPEEMIRNIKSKKRNVGIAINPKTSVEKIKPFLDSVSLVLVMTVHPGRYGSKFLSRSLEKVKELRKLKPELNIEVDGGINDKTILRASKTGANGFVVGSYIQKSENPQKALKNLKEINGRH